MDYLQIFMAPTPSPGDGEVRAPLRIISSNIFAPRTLENRPKGAGSDGEHPGGFGMTPVTV